MMSCISPSGPSLERFTSSLFIVSLRNTSRSISLIVRSVCSTALATVAAVLSSKWKPRRSGAGMEAAEACSRAGMSVMAVYTSLKKLSTATPSPQACSQEMPARPFLHTAMLKHLSNQRSRSPPCSIARESSSWVSGVLSSREMTNKARSTSASEARFMGLVSMCSRASAHSSRFISVSAATRGRPLGLAASTARICASICEGENTLRCWPSTSPSAPSNSRTLNRSEPRMAMAKLQCSADLSSSLERCGTRVEQKRRAYWDMSRA
mmetsp:Transcript_21558/g.82050  ORF Transcript_21558/g.82050 Transcript_21558/m.82050 type:complete len:266 (-) Transcript_21558:640-1437(-)